VTRPFSYGPKPLGWKPTQLREVLRRRRETGRSTLPLLSVNLRSGVVLRDSNDARPAPNEDLSIYQVVHRGDLVMNRLGKPHGAIGVSAHDGIISPAYLVCEILDPANPRYIHHLLRTRLYISEYERRGKWMPPSQFDISWESFRTIPILLPPTEDQERIADVLDRETARIDGLISQKRRLIELADERIGSAISALTGVPLAPRVSLGRFVARIDQGYSPVCDAEPADIGWGVLKLSAVHKGRFRPSENKAMRLGEPIRTEYRLKADDVLVTRANTPELVGDACLVPSDPGLVLLPDLIYRIRLRDGLEPRFLVYALLSAHTRGVIERTARGSSQSMVKLRADDLLSLLVPLPSRAEQRKVADDLDDLLAWKVKIAELVTKQIGTLQEHHQALITAAVTGQIDVPGAAA
jgi:type I restriction enzyme S subunit